MKWSRKLPRMRISQRIEGTQRPLPLSAKVAEANRQAALLKGLGDDLVRDYRGALENLEKLRQHLKCAQDLQAQLGYMEQLARKLDTVEQEGARAAEKITSINAIIIESLRSYLDSRTEINHVAQATFNEKLIRASHHLAQQMMASSTLRQFYYEVTHDHPRLRAYVQIAFHSLKANLAGSAYGKAASNGPSTGGVIGRGGTHGNYGSIEDERISWIANRLKMINPKS